MAEEEKLKKMKRLKDELTRAYIITVYLLGLPMMRQRQWIGSNHLIQDGIIRHFEIIGEVPKRWSKEKTVAHPDIPWRDSRDER